jgi:lipoprotein-releasing system permease protein
MNFRFFVAKRYLFSKKSANIINIISLVAGIGVAVGTMALIIVLSVFNGLEDLLSSRINTIVPDIKITPKYGKTFATNSQGFEKIRKIDGIAYYCETIEENVLIKYGDTYNPFKIKGVDDVFEKMSGIKKMMKAGEFKLHYQNAPLAVVGQEVAENLKMGIDFFNPLKVYFPNRFSSISSDPENAFIVRNIFPAGVFAIDHDFDRFMIVPIGIVREILNYNGRATAIEIAVRNGVNPEKVQKQIQKLEGNNFYVKNRFQQNELMYKVMKTEKLMVYLILTFIILIASFNIIGSLTMLIIDKKQDARIIQTLGSDLSGIRKIFLYEGWMISLLGTLIGLLFGALICWLQIEYGFIKLKFGDTSSFIVDAYPVKMNIFDFILVFFTVFSINFLISWYPVRYLTKKYIFNSPL